MNDSEMPEDVQHDSEESTEQPVTQEIGSSLPESSDVQHSEGDGKHSDESEVSETFVDENDSDDSDMIAPATAETFDLTQPDDDDDHVASDDATQDVNLDHESEVEESSEEEETPEEEFPKNWYIVKVTSGRETSIKAAIERRVKIEGLEQFFGQVYIPVEKVIEVRKIKETRNGEKVTRERRVTKAKKKFPGYVMAEVHFNDEVQFLFRETAGVGDFVGSSPGHAPQPMADIDVRRMLGELSVEEDAGSKKKVKVKLDFEKDDKVRIREGAFANMEGEVKEISEPKEASETPRITVVVPIFGRPVEVVLDYWQVDKV